MSAKPFAIVTGNKVTAGPLNPLIRVRDGRPRTPTRVGLVGFRQQGPNRPLEASLRRVHPWI
jgi:hypothetical protein